MRTLEVDRYTAAEVAAQLSARNAAYTCRFELQDRTGAMITDRLQGVITATRTFDSTRAVKGSLDLTLDPIGPLADGLFAYRIKPWFGVRMPDGGVAEYPQGVYLWSLPDRTVDGEGAETWTAQLGDLGHFLDISGPGLAPFQIQQNGLLTEGLARLLRTAGFSDAGVVPSEIVTTELMSWSMRRNVRGAGQHVQVSDTPETWRTIAGDITKALGYNDVWFDADGLPIAEPARDLQGAAPDVVYDTGHDGLIVPPISIDHDWDEVANRVAARTRTRRPAGRQNASGATGSQLQVEVADANQELPGHPLAQSKILHYIDQTVDLEGVAAGDALRAAAKRELLRRITGYEVLDLTTLAWPVHEGYEVVQVTVTGDRDLDGGRLFAEEQHTLDLRSTRETGTMTHRLRAVVDVTDL